MTTKKGKAENKTSLNEKKLGEDKDFLMKAGTSSEELKASKEELKAINEELRSTAEELENSKEELQSVNEELTTVNNELKVKIDEVRHANSDLENLIRSTNIATIFLDKEMNIKRYTPSITSIFNLIPGDIGRPLSHITHRLSSDNFQKDATKVLESLQPIEREVYSDDNRVFIARLFPYRTIDDKIEGTVISFIDISENEKGKQKILEERNFSESIIATIREPLLVLNKDMKVVSANRYFCEIFQVQYEEYIDKSVYELGNNQWDIPKLHELLETILPQKKHFSDFEVSYDFEDIGQRTMLLNAREIIHNKGEERLILLAIEDVTESKRLEKKLGESEVNYRGIVNQTVAGILKVDAKGHFIFSNKQMAKMLGYELEEMLQLTTADVVHKKDIERNNELFEQMLSTGDSYTIEKRMICKDGHFIWCNNQVSPILDQENRFISAVIVSIDITEQKKEEEQKDDFIGIASHELKTPLTGIKAYSELLLEKFSDEEQSESFPLVQKLNKQVDRLNRLVYGLLDTTRISEGRFNLEYGQFDLNELIEKRVSEARLASPNYKFIIEAGEIQSVSGDSERIGQVLTNLISNAVKYSQDDDRVIISSEDI